MPAVLQFAYGPINPAAGLLLACIGTLIGFSCTAQARETTNRRRRRRWLWLATVAMGGGLWMMHFVALLGFDVPASPVRYDLLITLGSALLAGLAVAAGLFLCGYRTPTVPRTIGAGLVTGAGMAATHYVGLAGIRIQGGFRYDTSVVGLSVVMAVVAASIMLCCSVAVHRWWPRVIAAAVTGLSFTAMHYTAMSAVRVHLRVNEVPVDGINPIVLVLPITIGATAALVGLVFTAMQAVSEEEFAVVPEAVTVRPLVTDGASEPHAVTLAAFSAQHASELVPRRHRAG